MTKLGKVIVLVLDPADDEDTMLAAVVKASRYYGSKQDPLVDYDVRLLDLDAMERDVLGAPDWGTQAGNSGYNACLRDIAGGE